MTDFKKVSIYYDRQKKAFIGLNIEIIDELQQKYSVNVQRELKRMSYWLQSMRGLRRRGSMRFIISWLDRSEITPSNKILDIAYEKYLGGLWKNRESLLQMNTI